MRRVLPRSNTLSTLTPRSAPVSVTNPRHLPSNLYSWLFGDSHSMDAPVSDRSSVAADGSLETPDFTPGTAHALLALRLVSPSRFAVSTYPTPDGSDDCTHTTSAGSSWLLRTSARSPTRRSFHRMVSRTVDAGDDVAADLLLALPPTWGSFGSSGRRILTHGVALTAASDLCLK